MSLTVRSRRRLSGWRKTYSRQADVLDRVVLVLCCVLVAMALLGPIIAPASVLRSDVVNALQPPSGLHWLGTDDQGRDVFWRIVAGSRDTLLSAVAVVFSYALLGSTVATVAVLGGKVVDDVLMRITDITLSLPGMVVALGIAAALGPSLRSATIGMVLVGWPMSARLLRGVMKETMSQPYVTAVRLMGASKWRILWRYLLPNSIDIMIVKWAADIGITVLVLAGLSFIGVGAQPPSPEWGAMVAASRSYVSTAWWTAVAPGAAIAITAMSFGLLGDFVHKIRQTPAP